MVATVTLVEAVGALQDERASENLHILGYDRFSEGPYDYGIDAIEPDSGGAPVLSYERWFRFKFEAPFTNVSDFKFWTPGLVVPTGWAFRWGSAVTYQQPTNSQSAIAVSALPTTEPGVPNIGGVPPLDGNDTRYSLWVVLQASVNGDAEVGPMVNHPGIQYQLDWTET